MRFVILNTDYEGFLSDFYSARPGLADAPYQEQLASRAASQFGFASAYSRTLRELGHEGHDIYINNSPLQEAWAREHHLPGGEGQAAWSIRLRRGLVPWLSRERPSRLERIVLAQLQHLRPDVVLNQAMPEVSERILRQVRGLGALLVGQHAASPLPEDRRWRLYDLAVSSFPPTVSWFRARGVRAELHRLAFDPAVLDGLAPAVPTRPVTFVGSLLPIHATRIAWLERVCQRMPVEVHTPDLQRLAPSSPIRRNARGPVWGTAMYQVLRESRITLNHHGDVLPHANNLRLYEATGVGTMLITDRKPDLGEMFSIGSEIEAYDDADQCVALTQRYLLDESARSAVAAAGQRRTLDAHTYARRMAELVDMTERLRPARSR
jgi:hypothetical protein